MKKEGCEEHVRSIASAELGHSWRFGSVSYRSSGSTFPVCLAGALGRISVALGLRGLGHRHGISPPAHSSRIPDTAVARMPPDHLRHPRIAGRPAFLGRDPPTPSS